MSLIIQKFGGTSVADKDRICAVAEIIARTISENDRVIAVVSAMAGATNSLISRCLSVSKLTSNDSLREYDFAVSSGEILTAAMLALALESIGIRAKSLQGWQVPIITDDNHSASYIEHIDASKILQLINHGITPVITGFQGMTNQGEITTLGKGGSDTTAALIAASVRADRCDIYTDVDGVYSADPRMVYNAHKLDEISIEEMVELCSLGAKVLHPRAALAAMRYNFDMQILSSFSDKAGTMVIKDKKNMEKGKIKAITSDKNILFLKAKLKSASNLLDVMGALSNNKLCFYDIQTENEQIFLRLNLLDQPRIEEVMQEMLTIGIIKEYNFLSDQSSVSMIGAGLKTQSSLMNQLVESMKRNDIEPMSISCNENAITLYLKDAEADRAVKVLHEEFVRE